MNGGFRRRQAREVNMPPQTELLNRRLRLERMPRDSTRSAERSASVMFGATFKDARRDQNSVSSSIERRLLRWLAEHTPARINSDHLTLLGFGATCLAGLSYLLARWNSMGLLGATACLALNWLGDSLDGTLARVRNRERPRYGFYLDHMLDTFGALVLVGGLAASGYLDWRVAAGMLVVFLMLAIEVYLATYTLGVFRLSFWRLGPTEIRILLGIANLVLWFRPSARVFGTRYRLLDFGGCAAIAGMGIMLIVAAAEHTITLYREERLP
jgi:archaetidylinositol phosphate synthase